MFTALLIVLGVLYKVRIAEGLEKQITPTAFATDPERGHVDYREEDNVKESSCKGHGEETSS